MAEGRMLKKRISKSRKLARLKNDRTRVLYLLILPHLDCEGRIEGNPHIIKGQVCPYLDSHTLKNIDNDLKDLHRVGLILYYIIDDEAYLQFTRFDEFQTINKSREAASHIPPPPNEIPTPEQVQSNSGTSPAQVNLKESKLKHLYRFEE